MADDNQEKPLYPAMKPHLPSITLDEAMSIELNKQHKRFHNRTICCGIITAVILIISFVMLVLGFTILHVKNPKINMNSVTIIGLDRINITDPTNANLTLIANVSVKNPNVAAFKFEKSNSSLLYHGLVVGVADIPAGIAKARRTMRLNVTVEVIVAKIGGNREFLSDLRAGMLPMESYTKIDGRVKIMNVMKKKVTITMNCSFVVNVISRMTVNQNCKKHVSV